MVTKLSIKDRYFANIVRFLFCKFSISIPILVNFFYPEQENMKILDIQVFD